MVSLSAAKRQGDQWFDGIIGIEHIENFNVFNHNHLNFIIF